MKHLPIWTPLASVALAFAWLLPNASPPWLAFHKDAWMATVLLVVFAVMVFKTRRHPLSPTAITPLPAVLLLLAGGCVLQWATGEVYSIGHALLGAAYFLGAALCVVLAQRWEQVKPHAVGDFLFSAVLVAALVTSALMLTQSLRMSDWEVWIQPVPLTSRPFGNLIQPNHAATLLALAMVSMLWWVYRGKARPSVALLGAGYFGMFVAMSGSRVALLALVTVEAIALFLLLRARQRARWIVLLLVQMLLLWLAVYYFNKDWGPTGTVASLTPGGAFHRDLTSVRQQVYLGYLEAVWQRPWLGYGFAQTVLAQAYLGSIGVELPGLFTWAHNAFLDLALWFGLPLSLLAVVAVGFSLWRLLWAPRSAGRWIYLAAMWVIFLHGMVELPLAYAYFLFPLALLAGAAQAGARLPGWRAPEKALAGALLAMGVYLAMLWHDYLRIEEAFNIWRFKQSNIGTYHPKDIPRTQVLDQLEALLTGLRADETLEPEALEAFRNAVLLNPSAAALQQLAELQVRGGEVQAAQQTADLAWLLSRPDVRLNLARRWHYLASQNPAYRAVTWRAE